MLQKILGLLSSDMAIDLGTANTIVHVAGKGIVLNEPSVVAVTEYKGKKQVIAVGEEAKKMLGRTPGDVTAIRPLKDGVIADFDISESMIKHFIRKVHAGSLGSAPQIIVCVPYGATAVERRAIRDSAEAAGARNVFLVEEPMAAAIGARLPVTEAVGSMVVDVGGGTTEIAVISLGGVVYGESLKVAGDQMDLDIINYIRHTQNLLIGETTAEEIKQRVGIAYWDDDRNPKTMLVRGRNLSDGFPKEIEISERHISEALQESVNGISNGVRNILEKIPPQLAADIVQSGIMLTGGGALLNGLDEFLRRKTLLPVSIADEPLLCVAFGTGRCLEEIKTLEKVLVYSS